jgi:hypothetical protein
MRARTPLHPGPAHDHSGPFLISYTQFTPHSWRDMPAIAATGLRLLARWPELGGAVTGVLYIQPLRKQAGSLSVWTDQQALQQFIRLPEHIDVMRKYRSRGQLRSTSWWADRLDARQAIKRGERLLRQAAAR